MIDCYFSLTLQMSALDLKDLSKEQLLALFEKQGRQLDEQAKQLDEQAKQLDEQAKQLDEMKDDIYSCLAAIQIAVQLLCDSKMYDRVCLLWRILQNLQFAVDKLDCGSVNPVRAQVGSQQGGQDYSDLRHLAPAKPRNQRYPSRVTEFCLALGLFVAAA
jgi:hypothetical protein